jgi:beta-phosphoglucomutase-like phosphatase (HAD superfamily)
MKPEAIIFDVDGTIANSERWGHLPACNEAFKILGLPLEWDWPTFKQLLTIPGNANRVRHELTRMNDYAEPDINAFIEAFVPIKKELYITKYLKKVELRSGIKEFIEAIVAAHTRLAIVSTSYEAQINELLSAKLPIVKSYFKPILGKESGVKTGEYGVLYEKCLAELDLPAEKCLVIEDSGAGFEAAKKAGIPTVIFYNDYTEKEDFTGALLVDSSVQNIDMDKLINGEY